MKPKNHRFQRLHESGLTIEDLAARLQLTPAYLRSKFARGKTPFVLAERLSREIGCRMEVFL